MRTIAKKYSRGFTLIELMVAMVIMTIGMMGLLDVMASYTRINLDNLMRNEAMRINEARMEILRDADFGTLTLGDSTNTVTRTIRKSDVAFTVKTTISALSARSRAADVQVTWSFGGRNHQHRAMSIISNSAW
jgi:type IV pilus assembly protein PilV